MDGIEFVKHTRGADAAMAPAEAAEPAGLSGHAGQKHRLTVSSLPDGLETIGL